MTKAVQFTMFAVGIVAVLIIVAIGVFAATFDINDYKERIAQAVEDETGRKLTFTGDLEMTYFPTLGVALKGVQLSNAEGFGQEPMAQVRSAHISVRIVPLFSGQVLFRRLFLDGLVLNLSRNEKGESNWDDLFGGGAKASSSTSNSVGKPVSLEVGGVTVKNASLLWKDRQADVSVTVRDINLDAGTIRGEEPFPVKGGLAFECVRPDLRGTVDLSGTLSLDLKGGELGVAEMKGTLKAEGKDVPGGSGLVEAAATAVDFTLDGEKVTMHGLTLVAYGATLHFDGILEGFGDDLKQLAGTVTVDPFDARKVLADMGEPVPDTADEKALTSLGVMAKMAYTPRSLALKDLAVDLDGSGLRGDFKVAQGEEGMSWFARLNADALDLDRYLPPESKETGGKPGGTASSDKADGRILDAEVLRHLTLDVEAVVARLRLDGIWLENFKGVARARHGLVRISPISADLYGGKLSLGATINALAKYPKTDILASLDKVDIGALSKDALGQATYGGILQFKATLTSEGDRMDAMLRSMNGKVSFNLADGIFPGVDLMRMAKITHESKDKKDGTVEAAETDSTRFGSIDGTGIINGGILNNRDLEVKAPGLRAEGEGAVSLSTRNLDYLLKVKLVPTSEGQGGKSSDEMFGVMVPIRVSGTLDNPHYRVSLTEYVKVLGGAVIGVAGTVLGGVKSAISSVGRAVTGSESLDGSDEKKTEKKSIFNLFGLF